MLPLSFYSAFIGTLISLTALTYLSWKEHNPDQPRTLSEIAAEKRHLLNYFRIVVWTCGTLFAITVFFYILPKIKHSYHQPLLWIYIFSYGCEVLLGVFAARKSIELTLHNIFSYGMAVGMVATAIVFAVGLHGGFAQIETIISIIMVVLSVLAVVNKKKFLFYELPFIYLSHVSIIVAALALR